MKPDRALPWSIDYETGVLPIAEDEGCRLSAYLCPAGVWTCGWGETAGVSASTRWSQAYADQRLCDSIAERVAEVRRMCTVEPTPQQLAALVRLAYNIGTAALAKSTVIKCHNRGDFLAAGRAFALWNKYRPKPGAPLQVSAGLTARRAREAAQYLAGIGSTDTAVPQAVAPESSPAASPINQAGAAAGAVAVVQAAGAQVEALKGPLDALRQFATDWLGAPAGVVPWLIVAGLAGVVVWQRIQQRRQGWA